jgi:dimethylargininase
MKKIEKRTIAVVREIPDSFNNCITSQEDKDTIDVEKARLQHENYCATLETFGIELLRISADESLPDCCFTEDVVIVLDEIAIITNPRMKSRSGERKEMEKAMLPYRKMVRLDAPAYLDGGDVVVIGKKIFVGLSERSNAKAIEQLQNLLDVYGYAVTGVPVRNVLHLKSACTYIGNGYVLLSPESIDPDFFADYKLIKVPKEESYCADTLAIDDSVLIPEGYPITKQMILESGFKVITLDTTEIKKADGALTCMSVIFSA